MLQNDLQFIHPDTNGQQICNLSISHLSFLLINMMKKREEEGLSATDPVYLTIMKDVHTLTEEVRTSLAALKDDEVALPAKLSLAGEKEQGDQAKMQFRDMLAWEVEGGNPDPGQIVDLTKYVPIDFMQLPEKVTTRDEAIYTLRMCDNLCTHMDNQPHCIKNDKFLIAAIIEHVPSTCCAVQSPNSDAVAGFRSAGAAS